MRIRNRRARGLAYEPLSLVALKLGTLIVVAGIAVWVLSTERGINPLIKSVKGVPIIVPIIAALLLLWTFVLTRTSAGRHLYAVGGNPEAARRAGIRVDRVRIAAFIACSTMAALGGIAAASRSNGVDPNLGGDVTLLYAVGAAVIGGTSLYGGRGRMIDAVLGGAVIAVIDTGPMGVVVRPEVHLHRNRAAHRGRRGRTFPSPSPSLRAIGSRAAATRGRPRQPTHRRLPDACALVRVRTRSGARI